MALRLKPGDANPAKPTENHHLSVWLWAAFSSSHPVDLYSGATSRDEAPPLETSGRKTANHFTTSVKIPGKLEQHEMHYSAVASTTKHIY